MPCTIRPSQLSSFCLLFRSSVSLRPITILSQNSVSSNKHLRHNNLLYKQLSPIIFFSAVWATKYFVWGLYSHLLFLRLRLRCICVLTLLVITNLKQHCLFLLISLCHCVEFRKTDRSLQVTPDGSSRVPFDPKQKPKFGVLKSPPTPLSTTIKKTLNANKKTILNTPKNTPKRRPSAADFF